MISLSYGYTVTYKNGWERTLGGSQWMVISIQDDEHLKIVEGIAAGLDLMDIPGIDPILEQMRQDVIWDDSWHNTNGTKRNSKLKKPREYQKIEMYLEPRIIRHIRSMKNPVEEMSRPEQKMTIYRSDGSYVTISYKNGRVHYSDSREKGRAASMTADTFLDWIVH